MKIESLQKQLYEIKIRHPSKINYYYESRYNNAAVKIQSAFRAFLARRLKENAIERAEEELVQPTKIADNEHSSEWTDDMIARYVKKIRSNVSPNAELFTSRKHLSNQCKKLDELMGRKAQIAPLSHVSNLSTRMSMWIRIVEESIATSKNLTLAIPKAPPIEEGIYPPITDVVKISHKESLKQASEGWWRHGAFSSELEFESWILELEDGIDPNKEQRYF